jgi:glycosyltransferase involved in cell wall biosynthesis
LRTSVPLVATDRYTHTQILNKNISELVSPDAKSIAEGINRVLTDTDYAKKIANNAKQFADEKFSDEKYIEMVATLYSNVLYSQR